MELLERSELSRILESSEEEKGRRILGYSERDLERWGEGEVQIGLQRAKVVHLALG